MKICHVITRLIIGGAQENTLLTCRGLVERGHDVTLIAGPETGPEGSLWNEAKQSGCNLITVDSLRRSVHPFLSIVFAKFCIRFELIRIHTGTNRGESITWCHDCLNSLFDHRIRNGNDGCSVTGSVRFQNTKKVSHQHRLRAIKTHSVNRMNNRMHTSIYSCGPTKNTGFAAMCVYNVRLNLCKQFTEFFIYKPHLLKLRNLMM